MRDIKFRAKDRYTGQWVIGRNIYFSQVRNRNVRINSHIVDESTIGQYSGLNDKDGKEIYEGDILMWTERNCKSTPLVCVFCNGAFGYVYCEEFHAWAGNTNFTFKPLNTDDRFAVIGNIYNNPDLITEINNPVKVILKA